VAAAQPGRAISMTGRTRGSSDATSREHNRFAGSGHVARPSDRFFDPSVCPVIMHMRGVEQRGDQMNLERSGQASLDCSRTFWNDAPFVIPRSSFHFLAARLPSNLAISKSTKSAWWKMIDSIDRSILSPS
jgi:hypothetical protein